MSEAPEFPQAAAEIVRNDLTPPAELYEHGPDYFRVNCLKPHDALPPNGRTKAIICAGGTFLTRDKDEPKEPVYYENLIEFIAGCNLTEEFKRRGLYQDRNGDYFLRDGTKVVFYPVDPTIDSTDATSEDERLLIMRKKEQAKRDHGVRNTDIITIQGTDTGAETAGTVDEIYGRNMGYGFAVVSSQMSANAPGSDGPHNFWTAFDATTFFKQAIVVSDNGRKIFSGNVRKWRDDSFDIYQGLNGQMLATVDMNQIRPTPEGQKHIDAYTQDLSLLPILPESGDYDSAVIKHYKPTAPGHQKNQAQETAREIRDSLGYNENSEPNWVPREGGFTALVIQMSGSGNVPRYAGSVLKATGNVWPIFASSDVHGAKAQTQSGVVKYAAAGVLLAKELGLNNFIELPPTRIGPDMRPEAVLVYAAKYSEPRTPEFLLFAHLLASCAWTQEDEHYNPSITGNRRDLVNIINHLEIVKASIQRHAPDLAKRPLSQEILSDPYVQDLLIRHIPHFVNDRGEYGLDENGKLAFHSSPLPSARSTRLLTQRIGYGT